MNAGAFGAKPGGKGGKNSSIADFDINKNTKSMRERLYMRYSPLVNDISSLIITKLSIMSKSGKCF